MTQQNEHLPAFGEEEAVPDSDSDFAAEHSDTAVDRDVIDDEDGEQESPRGWAGMDGDGTP